VRYINSTYNRTGTLWEGRAKSSLVDSEAYPLKVSKYIELNPVRARMVNHPAEYLWSSYRHNAVGKGLNWLLPILCTTLWGMAHRKGKLSIAQFSKIIKLQTTLSKKSDLQQINHGYWVTAGLRHKLKLSSVAKSLRLKEGAIESRRITIQDLDGFRIKLLRPL
jgi:putative transposase